MLKILLFVCARVMRACVHTPACMCVRYACVRVVCARYACRDVRVCGFSINFKGLGIVQLP